MDIHICITDSLLCTAETNKTLQIKYTPLKINLKKKNAEEGVEKGNPPTLLVEI